MQVDAEFTQDGNLQQIKSAEFLPLFNIFYIVFIAVFAIFAIISCIAVCKRLRSNSSRRRTNGFHRSTIYTLTQAIRSNRCSDENGRSRRDNGELCMTERPNGSCRTTAIRKTHDRVVPETPPPSYSDIFPA
ncbi:hypothetical protein Tcan_14739 [Toxocara canis]|uniref:Uncharacterized protein n=1 Tax=Toxocara canis TaxID=6265 RepID=A0A0B2UTF6_TOXCA|nr:hypothetical protein Tcan_14739 [Toxocara canis]